MNCANCGLTIAEDKSFCMHCGHATQAGKSARWPLLVGLAVPLALLAGEGVLISKHQAQTAAPITLAASILKESELIKEERISAVPPFANPTGGKTDSGQNSTSCPPPQTVTITVPKIVTVTSKVEDTAKLSELAKMWQAKLNDMETVLQDEINAHAMDKRDAEAKLAKEQADHRADLNKLQDAQDLIVGLRRQLADRKSTPPTYAPGMSGVIVWRGPVRGKQKVVIQDDVATPGIMTGKLPGVACFLDRIDSKINVSITEAPLPVNNFRRLEFEVQGNGQVTVQLRWTVQ
jgi:hypothetical protein